MQFIYVRCQNCNRRAPSTHSEPKLKRQKVEAPEKHAYPSLEGEVEDDTTHSRNMSLLTEELEKSRPSLEKVKNLMKRTFITR